MNYQRHAIGLIAIAFLIGAGMIWLQRGEAVASVGVCSRVGFLMLAIWLAYPQLESLKSRMSMTILSIVVGLLLIVAVRPKFFVAAALIAVGGFFLNAIIRRFSKSTPNR